MPFVRNLSIRVPWHDRGWDGHVCDAPSGNSSCLALKLIAENRKDAFEDGVHGEAFDELDSDKIPPCLRSSAGFLSGRQHSFQSVMAYSRWSKDHAHILPRTVHLPAWGALSIPYRWMLKESGFQLAQELELDASPEREPEAPDWLANTSWIQGFSNQQALLDAFAAPLIEEESLVLFYATRTPLCDDERRVVIGAALLQRKHDLVEYAYKPSDPSRLRSIVWERPLQHSLRTVRGETGLTGGFVLPYHRLQAEFERNPELDLRDYVAFAPNDARSQFSYGSEHVGHGAAAAALLAARASLERTADILKGPWARYIAWIDERLGRLWRLQGPAPGLGVVLSALHNGFNGTLFAIALADELQPNADPWPVIDAVLSGKRTAPAGAPAVTGMLKKRWERLKQKPAELDRLKLLARIELTVEQAGRALGMDAAGVLRNPYALFEDDRNEYDPVSFATIDRGIYPGTEVSSAHPLPDSCNPGLSEYDNEHRLRAATVQILEEATAAGHTLLPVERLSAGSAGLSAVHAIPLDADMVDLCRDDFAPLVAVAGEGSALQVQLGRYVDSGKLLASAVKKRLQHPLTAVPIVWRALIDQKFGPLRTGDMDEDRGRAEKAIALERLAGSRIGVLIGPAGTGKTSVLQLLLARPEIVGLRVRLLAPTGKARVRLGKETGHPGQAQTVAQLLLGDRFDSDTGRYFTNPRAPKIEATTCIVDESSMLTEDMLAAVVEALPENCRLILVGDPNQLPPIGAGCPFVDIIEYLKREHDGAGVGELNTPRRQSGNGGQPALARSDVQLAALFSGRALPPGEDEIVVAAIEGKDDETVKYRRWERLSDLPELMDKVLADELENVEGDALTAKLERSLGAVEDAKGYLNFRAGAADDTESWQILSLNRNLPGGSIFLNRGIKDRLRQDRLQRAIQSNDAPRYRDWMRFTKPRGPEQIVYGDKVICVRNHKRAAYNHTTKTNGEKEFVANGEIGMVTGQMLWGKRTPNYTNVEFCGRVDRSFSFRRSDFSEDGQPFLELAYAITVHKAQGSEFGSVILVLPAQSRLISREMIYTALTRQTQRVWILHQGPFDRFLSLRQPVFSDIAARHTNLLRLSRPQPVRTAAGIPEALKGSRRTFLEEKLIHRTIRGEMVSSKNELAIANILYALEEAGHLTYRVEPELPFDGARGRWADFLIERAGETWYWEHCGMMDSLKYRERWESKKTLYLKNGFNLYSPDNPKGRLIVTKDGSGRGLDSKSIKEMADHLFTR